MDHRIFVLASKRSAAEPSKNANGALLVDILEEPRDAYLATGMPQKMKEARDGHPGI